MIDLTGVSKVYPVKNGGQVVALDGVNLHVDRGSIHGIVGRSGAGKSTLIRCLTALEKPTEGHIVVDGHDLAALFGKPLRAARRRIGMVFQAANLLDARTAAENIGYPLKLAGVPAAQRRARVEELLTLVGLEGRGDSYPSQLSGGQRQRVGIARALCSCATSRPARLTPSPPRRSSRCCARSAMSPASPSSSSPTRCPSCERSATP